MQDKREIQEQEAFAQKLMAFSETLNEKERASLIMTLTTAQSVKRPNLEFFRKVVMSW